MRALHAVVFIWLAGTPTARVQAQIVMDNEPLPKVVSGFQYSHDLGDTDSFGAITDISFAGNDRVAVLDALNSRLSLFSLRTGTLVSVFGRRGRGPGEFFSPVALAFQDSIVTVLDQGNLRLVNVAVTLSGLSLQSEIRVPISSPSDVCVIGGRYFLLGVRDGSLIHEVSTDGRIINSFGVAAQDDKTAGELAAVGRLSCSDSAQSIAYVSALFGALHVYAVDGRLLWDGAITGFVRQEYEFSGAMMRPQRPANGFIHEIEAFQWLEEGGLFVQLRRSNQGHHRLHESRMLRVDQGWAAETPRWPTAALVGLRVAVFREEAPYPMLKVYYAR